MKSTFTPTDVQALLSKSDLDWWVAGGWALDLFLGKQTRYHEDLDISILRKDEKIIRNFLKDWNLHLGLGQGKIERNSLSSHEPLPKDREIIWCQPLNYSKWSFELLLSESKGDKWIFKRDSKVQKKIKDIGLVTNSGIPYLRPEIVLLFKAKTPHGKNQDDFEMILPHLDLNALDWLKSNISIVHPGHSWLGQLGSLEKK